MTAPLTPLLALTQWLSPAFPTGAFAYSHGLEQVVADGTVHDPATLQDWLRGILLHGAGRQDGALLIRALAPATSLDALDALDAMARALAPSAERLAETVELGTAFARSVAATTGRAMPPRALPVAVGEAARPLGLPAAQVAALYLQAFAGNLVTIATRHVPLGQSAGQRVLAQLLPPIQSLAQDLSSTEAPEISASALAADLAAMTHETKDVRLFRT
ncbi:urease accessory UreF family protein [Pararhodobacter sp. SW119]|uniref:urease accessory protein UreF n=1 Tax=Pararhodobacter sp. SW119 TaxID=2780075 RepID=UPI001ADF4952|nr:urease accessory UreF family protein [Pararhodobacter sp. SW119]